MPDPLRAQALLLAAFAAALLTLAVAATARAPMPLRDVRPCDFGYRVDVNLADAPTLRLLPGIGAVTARYVIDHRTEHGPFAGPDDLVAVPRLGPRTVARLRPYAVFETPAVTGHN